MKGLALGAAVGGCLACLDGAVLGALFAAPGGVAFWAGGFAAGGAVVGGLTGLLASLLGPRMVLRPPGDDEDDNV